MFRKYIIRKFPFFIIPPALKDKTYNIVEGGAVADDSSILNHQAINSAIDLCSKDGGGTVFIPKGIWHTGPIVLKTTADGLNFVNTTINREQTVLKKKKH